MNRIHALIAAGVIALSASACTPQQIAHYARQDNQAPAEQTTTTFWFDIGEPLVAPLPDFATQTAPQAPGSEDDGRFETGPAPQAPCDAPYPACGRP